MTYSLELQVALEACTAAAALCGAVRAELVETGVLEKGDRSPVTLADYGAQALICRQLAAAFPADRIVAEEDTAELLATEHAELLGQVVGYVRRSLPDASTDDVLGWIDLSEKTLADRYWTLDPIDGTKGFLRNDQYAIALALIEQGQVQVGVLACPALPWDLNDPDSPRGVLFAAVRGQGASMRPLAGGAAQPIRVAQAPQDEQLRSVESVEHGNPAWQAALSQALGINAPALRMDSQAKYGVVARGDAVLYMRLPSPKYPDYRENIWDHAGGVLLVEEAGGRVTDMHGQPLDFAGGCRMVNNRGVVVSNGVLHDALLATIADLPV